MTTLINFTRALLLSAALLLCSAAAYGVALTIELNDCTMDPSGIGCIGGTAFPSDVPIAGDEPLWIDFTLDGVPMAHLVTPSDGEWIIEFFFDDDVNTAPPVSTLAITDMDDVVPGLGNIPAALAVGGALVYQPIVPGGTFVHDLHIEPGIPADGTVALTLLNVLTPGPLEKGVWVIPTPSPLQLLAIGVLAFGVIRRSSN